MFSYDTINSTPREIYSDYGLGGTGYYGVFLNPGQAPNDDPGECNINFNVTESELNLAIAERVAHRLKKADCHIEMLQGDSICGGEGYPERGSAVYIANMLETDIFVSIHCSSGNGDSRGCEVLCYKEVGDEDRFTESGLLANYVDAQLYEAIHSIDPYFPNRGVKERPDLPVLSATVMPAIVVNCAFIDNDIDCCILCERVYEIGEAIAIGIINYLEDLMRREDEMMVKFPAETRPIYKAG